MIYFIANESTGDVKIGCAVDVQRRLRELQCASADPLVLARAKESGLKNF
jgi:hypothetical protein